MNSDEKAIIDGEVRIIAYIVEHPDSDKVIVRSDNFTHDFTIRMFHIIYELAIKRDHATNMNHINHVIVQKVPDLACDPRYGELFAGTDQFYTEQCFVMDQMTLQSMTRKRKSRH